MACKSCGAGDFSESLGKCARCTSIAGASAVLFWSLYVVAKGHAISWLITWPLLGFAALVSLLFIAHILGHLSLYFNK